jgi:hypothetical protein
MSFRQACRFCVVKAFKVVHLLISITAQNEKWNAHEQKWRLLYFKCCSVGLVYFIIVCTLEKKLTHFATKSSEIIIASRKVGSALQNQYCFIKRNSIFLMILNFVTICDYTAVHRNTTRVCQYKNYK